MCLIGISVRRLDALLKTARKADESASLLRIEKMTWTDDEVNC